MALLESIHLEHLPVDCTVHVALYESVKNAAFLQQQLLAGNSDFEYALIDASVIVSRMHVLAAAYRAINDLVENRLRSRNVHSEIVFCLSPNNNIAESFRRFGIAPSTSTLLVLKVSTPAARLDATAITTHLTSVIEGSPIPFTDDELAKTTDWARVKKIYKLNAVASAGAAGGGGKRGARGAAAAAAAAAAANVAANDTAAVAGTENVVVTEVVDEKKELEVGILGMMTLRGVS